MIQGRFKCIKKKFKGFFMAFSWQFQRCFKEVSRVFKDSVKCVSRKFQIKFQEFSSMFQWSFCNFIVAWISSQLPEQKEGLFIQVWQPDGDIAVAYLSLAIPNQFRTEMLVVP